MKPKRFNFDTSPSQSARMKKISSKDTGCEMVLRKMLWQTGARYRLHAKDLPGKPDIIFKGLKLVIFIDGDFWHGFNWEKRKPGIKANREYWIKKIEGNIARDVIINGKLKTLGFTVLRFWEHDVLSRPQVCIQKVMKQLRKRLSANKPNAMKITKI